MLLNIDVQTWKNQDKFIHVCMCNMRIGGLKVGKEKIPFKVLFYKVCNKNENQQQADKNFIDEILCESQSQRISI